MAFKMVTDSEKVAGRVAGVAKAHAEEMTAEQVERWRDSLPDGAEDVGIGQIQRFYAARLRRLCRAMTRAEKAHIRQLTAVKLLRRERDEAAAQARHKAFLVEKVLQGRHGEVFAEVVLAGAAEVSDPVTLARVATHAAKNLVDPEREVPEPLVAGTELDFKQLAWEIAEPAGRLSAHLEELGDQLAVLSATLERKIQTLNAVKDLTKRLARFLEGLYGLEGHDELQATVKRALRKARKAVAAAERRKSAEAGDTQTGDIQTGDAEAGKPGDAKAKDVVNKIVDAVVAVADPGHEDGRLRKAAQRLAHRESPMAAFDEGMGEALAEAAKYHSERETKAQKAEAQEAEALEAGVGSGSPHQSRGTSAAATASPGGAASGREGESAPDAPRPGRPPDG